MIIVNFAHPVTDAQRAGIERLTQQTIDRIIDVPAQFQGGTGFAAQAHALVDSARLSAEVWQTQPLLIVLPSLNVIAAIVLAEIHGRSGYFPAIVRMHPVADAAVRQFEAAEIVNLQSVRDKARESRKG